MTSNPRFIPLALGSLFAWGLWAFLPKLALQSMTPNSVLFYESFSSLFICLSLYARLPSGLQKDRSAILMCAAGSFAAVGANIAYFYALQHGPVAVVVTLTGMYPIVSLLLARIVLGEKVTRLQGAAIGMALGSMALLVS